MRERTSTILLVEDEPTDAELLRKAFARTGVDNPVHLVANGEEAIEYLTGKGRFADRATFPFPKAIVTDLKMPHLGGIELLRWIKANPQYRVIPTIVLTSSLVRQDVNTAFECGANAYIPKPASFPELVRMARILAEYWQLSLVPDVFSPSGRPAP